MCTKVEKYLNINYVMYSMFLNTSLKFIFKIFFAHYNDFECKISIIRIGKFQEA